MPSDSAKFQEVVPILTVENLDSALQYYERVLGFRTDWVHGQPPTLAGVSRDSVELNLRLIEQGAAKQPSRLYFQMTDVDSLYRHVISSGAEVKASLADRAYGMRDFSIHDPSGNELGFGQSIVP